jgi:leucine dehydrogenase
VDIQERTVPGFERVLFGSDSTAGYRGIVALHSTALGPAIGGTRFWNYESEDRALTDALRLARGMTYKNALADIPFGGGKSVIIGDNKRTDREPLFRAHGRLVEELAGKYITAEDVGTSTSDMNYVLMETKHVGGLAAQSGDPSPITARGVYRAIQATAKLRWGSEDLSDRTVALQGCGHVGYYLAEWLHKAGAKLIVSDVDEERVRKTTQDFQANAVPADEIYRAPADIFAPCALGAVLNDSTIPQLRVAIVAGAANNQLGEPRHAEALRKRDILYAPDYAANAGGVIWGGCIERMGWDRERTLKKVDAIYDTILSVFDLAGKHSITPAEAADRLAENRFMATSGGARQA